MGTDSLYYIMDYSGNYYRTDKADQLVAVAGEQDATVFTFAQANSRICVGKKASFYCMVPIEEREIHRENKSINRNLQRLANIGLIGLLGKSAEVAKKTDDSVGKTLAKTGLILVVVSEIVLMIADIIDYREEKIEQQLEEDDE